jgi:hypothetical protein
VYDASLHHVQLETFSQIRELLEQVETILERAGMLSPKLLKPLSVEARITFLETFQGVELEPIPSGSQTALQAANSDPEPVHPRLFGLL